MKNLFTLPPHLLGPVRAHTEKGVDPFYLYDKEQIRRNCHLFRHIAYPHTFIHFATMANDHPDFIRTVKKAGLNIFVNSLSHLRLARDLGFKDKQIVFTASAMDDHSLRQVKESGALLNLDSSGQLHRWQELFPGVPVGIRCNIGDFVGPQKSHAGYFIGPESRLGFTREEILKLKGSKGIYGLHLYAGTDIVDIDYFLACYRQLADFVDFFPALEYLNFGGGFGLSRENLGSIDFELFGRKLTALMENVSEKVGRPLRLLLEPGRIIGANAGYFVCRAVDIKLRNGKQLVGVNSSSVQFPRPLFYPDSAFHPVCILRTTPSPNGDTPVRSSVYGCSTYSRDFLARDIYLPRVAPQDLVIFGLAGSYCATAHTRFLGFEPAPEIFYGNHGS
jgi:diaminopimelate decarboxylase